MFLPVAAPVRPRQPRRQFTYEEDKVLREAVAKYGENWELISREVQGRSVRQCRDRWNKYLSPQVNDRIWVDEEDDRLLELIEQIGTKWARISQYFPGRSDINIKNRYKHLMANGGEARRRERQMIAKDREVSERYGKLTRNFLETRQISEEIVEQAERYNQAAIDALRGLFLSLGPVHQKQTSQITTKM